MKLSDNTAVTNGVRAAVLTTVAKVLMTGEGKELPQSTADQPLPLAETRTALEGFLLDRCSQTVCDGVVSRDWHLYLGGQFCLAWQAHESFLIEVCGVPIPETAKERSRAYRAAQEAVCWWWPHPSFIVASNRPVAIHRNAEGRLHKDGALAIRWPDGWGHYALNGVRVPEWLAMTPEGQLDPRKLGEITNAEIRREFVHKVGIERICHALKAKVLDRDGDYELLLLDDPSGGPKRTYLKMLNPSIGTWHVEGVPNMCMTVAQALEFRKPEAMRKIRVADDGEDWYQQGDVAIWPQQAKSLKPRPKTLT